MYPAIPRAVSGPRLQRILLPALVLLWLPMAALALTPQGEWVTADLRIGAVIHTVEKGQVEAVWRSGETTITSRGDMVIWGFFYADPADVTWGDAGNPDLYVKIWFDVSGRVDVNFFHVSVPDISVFSAYGDTSSYQISHTTQQNCRYVRHYYEVGQAQADGPCSSNQANLGQLTLQEVNAARAQGRTCGSEFFAAAPALQWNTRLASAALAHSQDMAGNDFFAHQGSDGSNVSSRVTSQGYNYQSVGENIAAGYPDSSAVMAGWLDSPGHCANIMNPGFTEMGAARVDATTTTYGVYWTQVFGRPR